MAGNYPDVSSWRMAYDVDGTQAYRGQSDRGQFPDPLTQMSSGEIAALNDEDYLNGIPIAAADRYTFIVIIFPELRDLDGILNAWTTNLSVPQSVDIQVSSNTTNGFDGTWVSYTSSYIVQPSSPKESMRNDIEWGTALGVNGVRLLCVFASNAAGTLRTTVHLYGDPSPDENPQRLEIWHPTLDQRLGPADLDWGDVPRNTTEIREFRIKNMHPTLTANSVRAAMSILTDTTPSVIGQQSISGDGGATWASQQTLTSPLGPEAISPVLQLRRQTPANASLSLWWYRVFADCSSWT